MAGDLLWHGAWRKLGPDDALGIVSGVKVGASRGDARAAAPKAGEAPPPTSSGAGQAEQPRVEAHPIERPADPEVRTNGRVRMTRY